jgi:hypothetical protein
MGRSFGFGGMLDDSSGDAAGGSSISQVPGCSEELLLHDSFSGIKASVLGP